MRIQHAQLPQRQRRALHSCSESSDGCQQCTGGCSGECSSRAARVALWLSASKNVMVLSLQDPRAHMNGLRHISPTLLSALLFLANTRSRRAKIPYQRITFEQTYL